MAYYYSVRGWLEIDPDNYDGIMKEIADMKIRVAHDSKLANYAKGWCWSESPINWTRYVFYGADITDEGVKWFESALRDIARLKLKVDGYFQVQGEDGEKNSLYKIMDDELTVTVVLNPDL